ncbi:COMD5-like protein [Mya arenaria]|uniref:COMM domain-containing protein 5 n=1 Tax=Mya arenaria TaxID=6604 RepID=A0ABY7DW09_MYAAR|nr:COMD5-like protein [Mya arenaria]
MSIIQVTGTGKSVASDRTPFFGARIPIEIKSMIKPLSKLDKSVFRKILLLIVTAIEGNDVEFKQLKELESKDTDEETLKCSQIATRIIKTREDFHTDLASVVFGHKRSSIDIHSIFSRPRLPQLEALKWRVDVGISTSVLNRVLEPTVLMEMTLSDGNISTFEVPVSKFHELRFNVASVLKEMEDLEQRSILKIKD